LRRYSHSRGDENDRPRPVALDPRVLPVHGSRRSVWLVCAATAAELNGSAKVAPP
jgi:hypothetical protein